MIKTLNILLFLGIFLLIENMWADEHLTEIFSPPLTDSRQNVKVRSPLLLSNSGNDIYHVMNHRLFERCKMRVIEMLDPKKKMPLHIPRYLVTWGAIYAGMDELLPASNLVNKKSNLYVFGLLCASQYDKAAKTSLALLKKEPSNYGTLVVLGLLSVQNQDYFDYLKKAFAVNPIKTISIFDWQMTWLPIYTKKEWDFLDFYISLVYQFREHIQKEKLPEHVTKRLCGIIRAKYFTGQGNKYPELATLLHILECSVVPEQKPHGLLIRTQIYRKGKLIKNQKFE